MLTEERDEAHFIVKNQDQLYVLAIKRSMLGMVKHKYCFLLCNFDVIGDEECDPRNRFEL